MKEFIKKVKTKVLQLFGKLTKTAKEVIPIGIEIVNAFKKITDSKYADIFVEITPTKLDDTGLIIVRKIIPKILKVLDEWNVVFEGQSDEEILKNSILKINSYSNTKKNLIYLGIAASINAELSNGTLSQSESILATQAAYNEPDLLTV